MEENLKLVIENKGKENGEFCFDCSFFRGNEKVTYGDVTTEEKARFVEACRNMMGYLANIVLAELKKEN